jgi:putative ABC transport system permease protein
VSEVAVSVTLLVGAGLLIQSLYRMYRERLGFDPHGVMTFFTPTTAEQRKNAAAIRAFDETLLQRLRALPGVRAAAAVSVLPLTGQNNYPTERDGHPDSAIGGMEIRVVSPSYFETMGIPIVRGRSFNAQDIAAAPGVILVNQTVARRWWGEADPLGDRVVVGRYQGRELGDLNEKPREVVGVVADTKSVYLKAPARPTVYLPAAQTPWYDAGMNWVVRGRFSTGFVERARQAVAEIDPRQRVERVRSMDEIVASTAAESRFNALLFGIFGGLALVLATIGVYGLLAFSVARRTTEIGTRMALGANRAAVLKMVLKQGIALVVVGLILGLAGAIAVTRSLAPLLFGVRSTDPISFMGVAALMLLVGLVASYFPARRATRVDPMAALRDE